MNRFREARDYIGLTIAEVAQAVDIDAVKVELIEAGTIAPTPVEMLCLSRLYMRPPAYLRGEPLPPVEISHELEALMERSRVSDHDRGEIVDFVQFLRHRKEASSPAADPGASRG